MYRDLPLHPSLSQQPSLSHSPTKPPLNLSLPCSPCAAHVSGLTAISASQNKLSLMGVRQSERVGGEERETKRRRL